MTMGSFLFVWCIAGAIIGLGVNIFLVNDDMDYRNNWVKAFFYILYGPLFWILVVLFLVLMYVFEYTGKFFIKLFVNKGDKS